MASTPARPRLRFSLGWGNTLEQIERVIALMPPLVRRLRGLVSP